MIPEKLTKRHFVRKVAEIFGLVGKITPLTAHMKLDLHGLVNYKLGWDDAIPDELRPCWISHFDMIKEISNITFNRAIIPADAVSLEMETIDCGDASMQMACAAIYARFQRKNSSHSCQLVFSRSKILPEGLSQPRCELSAASLNAHTGEVVKRALETYHKQAFKLTDSQIVLHWLNNKDLPLKLWVRARVIEILRLNDACDWWYVKGSEMIADLGTRRGATVTDVNQKSSWNLGLPWMN